VSKRDQRKDRASQLLTDLAGAADAIDNLLSGRRQKRSSGVDVSKATDQASVDIVASSPTGNTPNAPAIVDVLPIHETTPTHSPESSATKIILPEDLDSQFVDALPHSQADLPSHDEKLKLESSTSVPPGMAPIIVGSKLPNLANEATDAIDRPYTSPTVEAPVKTPVVSDVAPDFVVSSSYDPLPHNPAPRQEFTRTAPLDFIPDQNPVPSADEIDEGPVDDIQEDILPIVAEELEELIPEIEELLARLGRGDRSSLADLHRKVHTLKGTVAMAGAMRIRTLVHSMETWMEEATNGQRTSEGLERVTSLFEGVKERLDALLGGSYSTPSMPAVLAIPGAPAPTILPAPKLVKVSAQEMDRLSAENNEVRLAAAALAAGMSRLRAMLRELQENGQRLSRVQRDLEIHAESQIQSRRAQLQEVGAEFDPLEMDRFTRLQEISRFFAESVSDAADIQRELTRQVADQEAVMAEQDRSVLEIGEGLRRTRLVPVDAINDRLHKVVWLTARELGKSAEFRMGGAASQGMDRVLLDRLVAPLEHILRNAVAHGIESPAERLAAGKPETGDVLVVFRQEAGRVAVEVIDDGGGLDPDRIRRKAIERGLWPVDKPMDEQSAADMICTPGFSTAEVVSQVAGRGVGMDVVRSEVLGMGGRFEISNRQGKGLRVAMFLPLTVASVSAVAVEAGAEAFAIPVEIVEHTHRLSGEALVAARATGQVEIQMPFGLVAMPYSDLAPWLGLGAVSPSNSVPVLVLREGDRRIALGADRMVGISDLPLRPLGHWWSGLPGVMGGVLLSNGRAAFLVDPLRMRSLGAQDSQVIGKAAAAPVILVVDDSITVRKATALFLERQGFRAVLARDGQEALEILVDLTPAAILLDVEMPRMDGFDCARNIKENAKLSGIPIAMVTSRTAEKHRRRAHDLGVNAYFGKPFNEEDILSWLEANVDRGA
jgi:chemosensory pili system protein ChpA (sensor histidine kinase/response regulator)